MIALGNHINVNYLKGDYVHTEFITDYFDKEKRQARLIKEAGVRNTTSLNTIFESSIFLYPIKSIILIFGPFPTNIDFISPIYNKYIYNDGQQFKRKIEELSGLIMLLSMPIIFASYFTIYRSNKILWLLTTGIFIITLIGLGIGSSGIIHLRYRLMIYPIWIYSVGVSFYYSSYFKYLKYFIPFCCIVIVPILIIKIIGLL